MGADGQDRLPRLGPNDVDRGEGLRMGAGDEPASVRQEPVPARVSRSRAGKQRAPTKNAKKTSGGASTRRKDRDGGADLERRVARVEFAEGALSRLRVPVHAEGEPGRDILTDIDVLSVDVDLRLRVSRSVLECKSGRGQAGEPDRLFWLAGFTAYLGADRAVLVRGSTTRRGVKLARRLGLHLLDGATLGAREAAHAWVPTRFAHVGGDECRAAETRTDTQLKAFGEMPASLIAFLRHDALLADSHQILGALGSLGSTVESMGILPDPAGLILGGHALAGLVLAGISDAAQAETLPDAALRRRLELALTTGTPDDDHVLEVLGQADELFRHHIELLHRKYVESGAKRFTEDVPSLRDLAAEPPRWVDRYLDLVERFRANPAIARDLLQTTELSCFDALLGGVTWKAPAFDHLFTAEHRNLLMVAVGMLREITGQPIVDRLGSLASLPFDRRAPALPDRRRPVDEGVADVTEAPLAQDSEIQSQSSE